MDKHERMSRRVREVEACSHLGESVERHVHRLPRPETVDRCGELGVFREHPHELSRYTLSPRLAQVITADSRDLFDFPIQIEGASEPRQSRQRLMVGGPVRQSRGELFDAK